MLYADEPFGVELKQAAYALDSTTIDLCLSLFPWAKFRRAKAAIKLHTLLALRGNYPTVVIVTTGRVHDVNILDQLAFEAGSFYIFDRGYLDFARLHRLHLSGAFFVTRAKKNFRFGQLYRCRWQIELFFKWIKQHLRIKSFYGTSDNAVRTQVWIAIAVYLLVALLKKRLKLSLSLHAMLQILSLTLFEKTPLLQLFSDPDMLKDTIDSHDQPSLPGFLTGQ